MFGSKKGREQELVQEGGVVAWATVIDVKNKWSPAGGAGGTTAGTDRVRVSLRVDPDGQESFEATFSQAIKHTVLHTGWECKVIFDPGDHSKIAVQENSAFPPGMDHTKAEGVMAMRTGAAEALRAGHIGEWGTDYKAKALGGELPRLVMVDGKGVSGGGAAKPDVADELTKLADLRDRGVLTEAEFEDQKSKLLAAG